jgi:hypothetical protein
VLPGRYRLSGVGNPDATDAIYDRIAAKLCTLKNQIAERISSLAHQIVQDEFNFFSQQLSPGAATQAPIRRLDHHIADGCPKSMSR